MDIAIQLQDWLKKELSVELDRRLSEKARSTDVVATLKGSEELTLDQITDSIVSVFARNGYPKHLDAQDYERNPDRRGENRLSFHQLVDLVNKASEKLKDEDKAFLKDNVGVHTNAGILIPRAISRIIRESVDPVMIGLQLLRRINFSGETVLFPAVGAYNAAEIGPGQEYPEKTLEFAGTVHARIGKHGVKVRILDEMLRYSMFDVMALHLRAGARAMARHKETRIFNMINGLGTTIYDNTPGAASSRGNTTGRGRNGSFNGTITLDDLFTMYADLMNAGFIPNTLIMNPMGWLIFVLNGTLRSFGFMNNGPLFGSWGGRPGQSPTWGGPAGGMGPAGGPAASTTPAEMSNATLYGNVPQLFPAPLSIAVSPFVTFSATCQTTTITMADRNELGFYIEDEPLVTETWDDPARDIKSTKFRERYALAVDNDGHAIANARGVTIGKGYDFEDFQVTFPIGTGTFPTGVTYGNTCLT